MLDSAAFFFICIALGLGVRTPCLQTVYCEPVCVRAAGVSVRMSLSGAPVSIVVNGEQLILALRDIASAVRELKGELRELLPTALPAPLARAAAVVGVDFEAPAAGAAGHAAPVPVATVAAEEEEERAGVMDAPDAAGHAAVAAEGEESAGGAAGAVGGGGSSLTADSATAAAAATAGGAAGAAPDAAAAGHAVAAAEGEESAGVMDAPDAAEHAAVSAAAAAAAAAGAGGVGPSTAASSVPAAAVVAGAVGTSSTGGLATARPFPAGWREMKSDGRIYYANTKTGKTQFEDPRDGGAGPMESIASSGTTTKEDPGPTVQPKPAPAVGSAATKGTAGAPRPLQKVSIPKWTGAKTLRCQDATVVALDAAYGAYSSMWMRIFCH